MFVAVVPVLLTRAVRTGRIVPAVSPVNATEVCPPAVSSVTLPAPPIYSARAVLVRSVLSFGVTAAAFFAGLSRPSA